ncbi:MAG: SRPBCC domain-containing protein [Chitinophagales bacterium]
MTGRTVITERVFDAPRQLVWRALTEKELMKQWYFDLKDFNPTPGFQFEFKGGHEDGIQYNHLCEITEVVTEQKLTYSWKYEGYEGISYVTFELFDEGGSTRLKLTHTGIGSFPSDNPDFAIHNFEAGWNHIIHTSLKNFLETSKQS